ncbi:MAG TPA: hypothetical protein VH437_19755 [Terriglobales bacterium]|jgi:hypothetical protein
MPILTVVGRNITYADARATLTFDEIFALANEICDRYGLGIDVSPSPATPVPLFQIPIAA